MPRSFPFRRLLIVAAGVPMLHAEALILDVLNPFRINQPGSVYTFDGQITNNTGASLNASDLFLNFAGYDPTAITPNQLLGSPDFVIPTGDTSPPTRRF